MSELVEFRTFDLNSVDYVAACDLRERLLRKPLGMILSPAELAEDPLYVHVGAFIGKNLVGCLIWKPVGDDCVQIRQVCVHEHFQGRHIGSKLMRFAGELIKAAGYRKILLHARQNAWPFYEQLGYQKQGEPFLEVGIVHQAMGYRIE